MRRHPDTIANVIRRTTSPLGRLCHRGEVAVCFLGLFITAQAPAANELLGPVASALEMSLTERQRQVLGYDSDCGSNDFA